MDISVRLDHLDAMFTNGDTVFGCVILYCPSNTTVSKITANLIGESRLSLTETSPSFLNWRQEEKHRFLSQSQVLVPQRNSLRSEPIKLKFGYHSFCFGLRIPESPDCCSCPPNSPVFLSGIEKQGSRSGDFPPTMNNLVHGVDVSYRIHVEVTTVKSLFKTTTTKSFPVTIWPLDPQLPCSSLPMTAFSCVESVTAKILGPASRLPPNNHTQSPKDPYLISTTHETANLLISAHFLPDFTLTHHRAVTMRLSVKQQNSTSHDLYLQSFQMLILGYTDVKVGTSLNTEMSCSTVVSLSNLDSKICSANSDIGIEYEINPGLWNGKQLLRDVVPSFESCGLARRYEVEILMGFQCRGAKDGRVLFVQLRAPVRISSGIYPNRNLTSSHGELLADEIPISLSEDGLSAYSSVANGFKYSSCPSGYGYDEQIPSLPPTYDEAIKIGTRQALEKEMGLTDG